MTPHTREGSSQRITPPTVTTTPQRHRDTADPGPQTDPKDQLLAALAANARRLANTTGPTRRTQLLDRAQLWEELAQIPTLAFTEAQTYRNVASVCRQESDTLNTSVRRDRHDTWGEKAA